MRLLAISGTLASLSQVQQRLGMSRIEIDDFAKQLGGKFGISSGSRDQTEKIVGLGGEWFPLQKRLAQMLRLIEAPRVGSRLRFAQCIAL